MSESVRRTAVIALLAVTGALLAIAPADVGGARPDRGPTVPTASSSVLEGGPAALAVRDALRHVSAAGIDAVPGAAAGAGRLSADERGWLAVGDGQHPVTITLPTGGPAVGTLTDVLVRRLGPAGTQVFTVIHGPLAPASFRYDLGLPPGTDLLPRPDGGAHIVDATGATVGSLAPPWAVAADGRHVPTRYVVSGSTLTQVVDHRAGMAYPVVADPAYQRNCGIVTCTWYVSVAKTKEVAKQLGVLAVNVAINLNVGAACSVVGVAGGPLAGVLCTVITAVGVAHAQSVFGAAARSGGCVRLTAGARAPLGRVALSNRYCSRK